jgi:hypothetical protein
VQDRPQCGQANRHQVAGGLKAGMGEELMATIWPSSCTAANEIRYALLKGDRLAIHHEREIIQLTPEHPSAVRPVMVLA